MAEDYLKVTGFITKAEDLVNIPGVFAFRGEDTRGHFQYSIKLNQLSLVKSTLTPLEPGGPYDYLVENSGGLKVRSSWITGLQTEVDWNEVPMDTLIEVSTGSGTWYKMYFATYDTESPDGKPYYTFAGGRTSDSALEIQETIEITLQHWDAVDGTYFQIFSKTDKYYVWFNLDGNNSDPGDVGGPLFDEGYTGLEIAIQTGEPADSIATKVKNALDALADFTVTNLTSTKIEVEVTNTERTYDALAATSPLAISIKMQGGDILSWPQARAITP